MPKAAPLYHYRSYEKIGLEAKNSIFGAKNLIFEQKSDNKLLMHSVFPQNSPYPKAVPKTKVFPRRGSIGKRAKIRPNSVNSMF